MKVIICGAGQVGYGIAERLSQEDNDVSVIDTSASLVNAITETLDVRGYVGHGAHPDILAKAGAEQADMIIAVTLYDEVNIVACEVAQALFSVPTKIARIRAQSYLAPEYSNLFSRQNMSIDVTISPEIEVGKMVLRRISFPGATDIVRFAEDSIAMLAIECMEDCPVLNTPLQQLSQLFPDLMATVVGIYRNGRLAVSRSADQLEAGDLAYVICQRDHVRRTLGLFGHEEQEARRIIIAGGGNIGHYVARTIEQLQPRTRLKIIETDRERAAAIFRAIAQRGRPAWLSPRPEHPAAGRRPGRGSLRQPDQQRSDQHPRCGDGQVTRLQVEPRADQQLLAEQGHAVPRHRRADQPARRHHFPGAPACSQGTHPLGLRRAAGLGGGDRGRGTRDVAAGRQALPRTGPARRHPHRRDLSRRYRHPPKRRHEDQGA
jgi:Trk K+ transport system NAD-binding subunit